MIETTHIHHDAQNVTRQDLIALLNEDLAGEFQAIISYVIYSQVIKGPQYMTIAAELEQHAAEELAHALTIAGQIDYLGGMPLSVQKPVATSPQAEAMLHFDLRNENETIARYRQRVRQCEALGEYAVAEYLRDILMEEQDHQIALANALGVRIPNVQETIETPAEMANVPQEVETISRNDIMATAVRAESRRTSARAKPHASSRVLADAVGAENPNVTGTAAQLTSNSGSV